MVREFTFLVKLNKYIQHHFALIYADGKNLMPVTFHIPSSVGDLYVRIQMLFIYHHHIHVLFARGPTKECKINFRY